MFDGADRSWDGVFGGLDARTLDHDERLDFINTRIERALAGKTWAILSGGEETQLVWDAAIRAFLEGNWLASLLCCHAVCEREIAGILSVSRTKLNDYLPKNWERLGMGGLVALVKKHGMLPDVIITDLLELAESRKPYGHWRSTIHDDSLLARAQREYEISGNPDRDELVQRLIVRDATNAMTTTISLYFGSYGLGGYRDDPTGRTTPKQPS